MALFLERHRRDSLKERGAAYRAEVIHKRVSAVWAGFAVR